ncbi:MAG TPA: preprotein translocase subunit SecA [Clostridiales bacterium]|nr:preprotein translocase subunit SecA [Clostridiales bacterium]
MLKSLKLFFDDNAKDIKKYSQKVELINALEPDMTVLCDQDLKAKTEEFKKRFQDGATLEELLPEAFAVVREAAKRVLHMRHFDVQLIGGMVLHDGRIAEMKTGEGKTLVATLPAYLNAITGRGVHVITVNDYLATRDSQWMGQVFDFLGLSVGLNIHGLEYEEKKAAYAADITYGTNNEFGFDYLRDNMAVRESAMVQRDLFYSIIDEVDSILIDEARTPLIISGQAEKPTENYYTAAKIVSRLREGEDYMIEEKTKSSALHEEGIAKVEAQLGIENLYADENNEWSHLITNAVRAKALFKKDRDYVVKDGEVIIVDEFTGRLMFGRRYSDGLHQALEAKENVKIERESQTLATITFQNYFRMYEKLAGMTGTAKTEENEFTKIYKMDVVEVPPNKEMIRKDEADVIYRTAKGKIEAIVDEIRDAHEIGRPVLVGTISIEKSEVLSRALKKFGVPHNVLNAKFHEKEAEIISQAGRFGAVTIATNMAGRGTDILLGGNPEALAKAEAAALTEKNKEVDDKGLLAKYTDACAEEKAKVVSAGGLYVIGTERHESRRIDNQLRGRSGRQGDPGMSRFYLSMEDDLIRIFGGDNMAAMMDRFGMDDTTPIDSKMVSKTIENAQKKVENNNFDTRKNVLDYDDVMNQQREVIYGERRKVLTGTDIKENILFMLEDVVKKTVDEAAGGSPQIEEWDLDGLLEAARIFLPHHTYTKEDWLKISGDELRETLQREAKEYYDAREEELGANNMENISRYVLLRVVDRQWMDHLDAMDQLRTGIGLQAIGQKNPLVEYKYAAFDMFQQMIDEIRKEVIRFISRAKIVEEQPAAGVAVKNIRVNRNGNGEEQTKKPIHKEKTVGRNDPCPCGSGKKYKKCCGRQQN